MQKEKKTRKNDVVVYVRDGVDQDNPATFLRVFFLSFLSAISVRRACVCKFMEGSGVIFFCIKASIMY